MKSSLVISTYNWHKALELVFNSILRQSIMPNEILIADDGSTDETRDLVNKYKKLFSIPLKHVWHEDKGFRKAIILNKAIVKSEGNYIIQVDGDCILHEKFIEDHLSNLKKGSYLFGSRVNIKSDAVSNLFINKQIKFKPISKLIKNRTRAIHSNLLSKAFLNTDIVSPKYRGCNTSFFKTDFEAVNGYNEDFKGWGREDSELAVRFHNYGLSGKRLRYCGIVYHIYHKETPRNNLAINDKIEEETRIKSNSWTSNGCDKYLPYSNKTEQVCVVIPVYTTDLSDIEQISLNQCIKTLNNYDIIFAAPNHLDCSPINIDNHVLIEKFDNSYFDGILGYNKMLLSHEFYSRFSAYNYMLIYQLDCYVFSDRLLYWCDKNYDYIGAPWMASKNNTFKQLFSRFDSHQKKRRSKIFFNVGNGGFSLRKTKTFIKITHEFKDTINSELKRDPKDYKLMEDVFWSFKAPKLFKKYRIPKYTKAIKFAVDRKPKLAINLNEGRLPFGCHGINKPKVINFWKEVIPEMRYLKSK
ncbi:DUF5672 family protein [Wenyingzhuangia sp. IMCC45533]